MFTSFIQNINWTWRVIRFSSVWFGAGVDVNIECKMKRRWARSREDISFSVNRSTDRFGIYRVEIPLVDGGVDCTRHPTIQSLFNGNSALSLRTHRQMQSPSCENHFIAHYTQIEPNQRQHLHVRHLDIQTTIEKSHPLWDSQSSIIQYFQVFLSSLQRIPLAAIACTSPAPPLPQLPPFPYFPFPPYPPSLPFPFPSVPPPPAPPPMVNFWDPSTWFQHPPPSNP